MAHRSRRIARMFTLAVFALSLAFVVWRAQRAIPSERAGMPLTADEAATREGERRPRSKYGIVGPGSKADPHMAHEAIKLEYERAQRADFAEPAVNQDDQATLDAGDADMDALETELAPTRANLRYLPGSKFGFGGLDLRGDGARDGRAPIGLGNLAEPRE